MITVKEMNKTLVVESERLGKTFTFEAMCIIANGENKLLIKHFDLEKIAREYGFVFDCEVVSVSPNVICVKGIMTDDGNVSGVAPWKVVRVGEVNRNTYTDEYTTAHPCTKAEQIAFDRCMIQMLGFFSKTYSDTEYDNLDYSMAVDKMGEVEYAPTSKKKDSEEEIFEESILDAKSEKTKEEADGKKTEKPKRGRKRKTEKESATEEDSKEKDASVTEENAKAKEDSLAEETSETEKEESLNIDSDAENDSTEEEIEDTTEDMPNNLTGSDDSEFEEEETDSAEEEITDTTEDVSNFLIESDDSEFEEDESTEETEKTETSSEGKTSRLTELENTILTFGTEVGKPLKEVSGRFLSFATTINKNSKHGEMAELIREYVSLANREDVFVD